MARPNIDLEMIGIPVGATLTLRRRDDVECVVVGLSPPEIVYEGEVVSLSAAAERAYGKERVGTTIEYWLYKGESLGERRRRFEAYHCNHE
ncbi:MAG: hypothetical protein OXK78_20030 [Caldilineaceae bacterium]|nr:hypothetical protein [Caldilineaceae bacterium]